MFWVDTNHAHHTLAVDDFTLVTHFLNRRSDFHLFNPQFFCAAHAPLSLVAIGNASAVQVVGRQLDQHSITRKNPNDMLAHFPLNVRQHLMLSVPNSTRNIALGKVSTTFGYNLYRFFLRHIRSERMLPVPTNCK